MTLEYVYIIKSLLLGGYKIGITKNLDRRMKQLEVPKKATKLAVFSCADARELERTLHKKYASIRIPQSEWFALNAKRLTEAIDYLRERCDIIYFNCPEYICSPEETQYSSQEKSRAYWSQYETPRREKRGSSTNAAPSSYADYSVDYTWHAPGQRAPEECAQEMMDMYAPWRIHDGSPTKEEAAASPSSVRPAAEVLRELERHHSSTPYYPPSKPSMWHRFKRWLKNLILIDDGERWNLSE